MVKYYYYIINKGMAMKRILGIALTLSLISACTTSMKLTTVTPNKIEVIDSKSYTIGTEEHVYVGNKVISRKSYEAMVSSNYVRPANAFTFTGGLVSVAISLTGDQTEKYKIVGVNELGHDTISIPGSHLAFGITKDGLWDNTVASSSFWTSPVGSGSPYTLTPANTKFIKSELSTPISSNDYINHELVFTGIGSDGIHLLYREYTFDNMARTAFQQELVYPIDSKEIRFKNYNIKVTPIPPSELTYTVISD
jgi:hypothetical protein